MLPVLATSENGGTEYGALPVFVSSNENDEIQTIVAPMYIFNEFLGSRASLNLIGFPTNDSDYRLIASYTETIERKLVARYRNYAFGHPRITFEAEGGFFKDATARFFGLSNKSRESDQTNYTNQEGIMRIMIGYRFTDHFEVQLTERFRDVDIQRGGVDSLPFITDNFSLVPGIGGATIVGHRLGALYDSRDDRETPTRGTLMTAFAELNQNIGKNFGTTFQRYHVEYTGLYPSQLSERFIFVAHAQIQTAFGDEIPFFEQSSLGGESTLRGFGIDRFIGYHSALFNIEERIQVTKKQIAGTMTEFEIAPFVDVGTVFDTFGSDTFDKWQLNPGIGFRAIAAPNIAARVDVGFGTEGVGVFAGLDFPF
ncbi:MAG: hypothetical protein CMH81_03255 [Nitrospiraceae bacterium]|nr:hypothetical protein [Nitrospiraceae bacterium]